MRIAQVSPLIASVPPVRYGGTERIVSYLTEDLIKLGHDVTLFASSDSVTNAHLIPGAEKALGYDVSSVEYMTAYMNMLEQVIDYSPNFDLIHFHTGHMHYALTRYLKTAYITTHHKSFDSSELNVFHRGYDHIPVVSVSDTQRKSFPQCNWKGTVPYGLPENLYTCSVHHDSYLAFLGQIAPDKGVLEAIDIALRLDMNIKIAAMFDRRNEKFFIDYVKPLLKHPRIEFVGEITSTEKNYFLGDACALLLPGKVSEPFEITAIEALACGTPVVALRGGSRGEIIQDGENGYLVDDVDSAVRAIKQLAKINHLNCRRSFEERFTSRHMVNNYLKIYTSCSSQMEIKEMHSVGIN